MTESTDEAAITLSSDEFDVVCAFHRGGSASAVAQQLHLTDEAARSALALAAEKLRVASVAPRQAERDSATFKVPHRDPCPFCRNIAGLRSVRAGLPAVVYEDELVYVFLAPRTSGAMPGHTLVITRRHVETILDLTGEEAAHLGRAVASAARMVMTALRPAGILIQQNNAIAAFQTVPHVHFHVIPKQPGPYPGLATIDIPEAERRALVGDLRRHWEL